MQPADLPGTDPRLRRDDRGRSQKVHPRHLDRLAVVYIRQSTMAQVHRHQESTKLQYGLVDAAKRLGWEQERILVIDEDLGLSGSTAVGREGFQRMLAEVALDHVGIILGIEMSRLARSNKDWHQLLELCARFGVLIADLDGLYDPSLYNDRLLLGLKGTMSEAELHILRQRLLQGKINKARRGELRQSVPTGYLRRPTGEVELDPDEEVRAVVRLIFDTFERAGTTHGVLRALSQSKTQIGVRLRTGPEIGKLVWRRPHRGMIAEMLRNPIYAGAYAYGRRRVDPRRQTPGRPASGRTGVLPPGQWEVCLPDKLPAYITWEQFVRNQERLSQNRTNAAGPGRVGKGSALLQGLVVCGHCGYRMTVQYAKSYARYVCNHAAATRGESVCCGLSTAKLDEVVTSFALSALAPAALDVSLRAAEELERERENMDSLWKKRLERARYESERAERQYAAVEPENRLVARTLETSWEAKLQAERDLREEYERHRAQLPRQLTEGERASIRALAHDLPELWNAQTTTSENRKTILRHLTEAIIVTVDRESEWMDIVIRWAGGHETRTRRRRPVARLIQMEGHEKLIEEIHALRRAGYTAERIAEKLNADGWVTPMQRNPFNARLIQAMMDRHGFVPRGPLAPPTDNPNDWRLADLARELDMPLPTVYTWMYRGWVKARQVRGQWIATANSDELEHLRRLRRKHPSPRKSRDS